MLNEEIEFHITLSIRQFNEIFSVLQHKWIANTEELHSLLSVDGLRSAELPTGNTEQAEKLTRENSLIDTCITNLITQTNKELGL